ncbi:peptidase domain-containing ABC transporter [Staphylococcus succinus]|uniref:peptidase domain-containing ABC transporter n=1 Tax=Staphylococcus succinus TaxID=61015 RepID=UPI000E6A8345|nr:peptidase domain-containing ABC transporter [Staphylococcus succinus]RIN36940.1 peptidase domain-containing ABC transporter [Staphylococcus succinus]
MNKIPVILQLQQTECGLCCSNMIINYYGNKENIFNLRKEFEVGRDGLNLSQIKEIFKQRNFDSKIYKANLQGLMQLTLPAILLWENKHFVVLEKFSKKDVTIVDPAEGRKKVTLLEFENKFSDFVLEVKPSDDFQPSNIEKLKPWENIKKILLEKWFLCFLFIVITIISSIINIAIPMITQKIIDETLKGNIENQVISIIFLITCAFFLFLILSIIKGIIVVYLDIYISGKLLSNTFRHLINLSFKFFDLRSPGDLLYRMNTLIGMKDLLLNNVIPGLIQLIMVITIFTYLFFIAPILAILGLIFIFINFLILFITRPKISSSMDAEIVEQTKSQAKMAEILYSILFVKMSGAEDLFLNQWKKTYSLSLDKFKNRSLLQNWILQVTESIQRFSPIIILLVGVFLFIEGRMTLGEVIATQTIITMLFGQTSSIFTSYTQFVLATSYLYRVSDITQTPIEKEHKLAKPLFINGSVKMKNVSFAHTNLSKNVLNDISLDIDVGERIAIVGKSGSGKSTLAKLMVGLYSNYKGIIEIDDINLLHIEKKSLHSQLAIVPQDNILFNKTIEDNITMNIGNHNIEKVIKSAQMAKIDEEIQEMPMKYNTVISDMGMNLSGGQRQRISLARAIIQEPKILVLDEATSSLDQDNEKKIMERLKIMRCTTIIVAHRLTTIKDADRILVMDKGYIIEQGTHNELLSHKGHYYHLYKGE